MQGPGFGDRSGRGCPTGKKGKSFFFSGAQKKVRVGKMKTRILNGGRGGHKTNLCVGFLWVFFRSLSTVDSEMPRKEKPTLKLLNAMMSMNHALYLFKGH